MAKRDLAKQKKIFLLTCADVLVDNAISQENHWCYRRRCVCECVDFVRVYVCVYVVLQLGIGRVCYSSVFVCSLIIFVCQFK